MSEETKKLLDKIDKVIKPISSVCAIIFDDHRIGWIARIPREIKDAIDAFKESE